MRQSGPAALALTNKKMLTLYIKYDIIYIVKEMNKND